MVELRRAVEWGAAGSPTAPPPTGTASPATPYPPRTTPPSRPGGAGPSRPGSTCPTAATRPGVEQPNAPPRRDRRRPVLHRCDRHACNWQDALAV